MTIERVCLILTAIGTVAAVLVAAVMGIFSLIASTRAWVGPVDATLTSGNPGTITVEYRNAGKEPAQQFGDEWDDSWIGNLPDGKAFREADLETNCISDSTKERCVDRILKWERKCRELSPFANRVAFPDFKYPRSKPAPWFDQADDNKIIFLQGCFVYRSPITRFSDHRSAFCYYFQVGPIGKDGVKMRACPSGNFAD